MPGNDQLATTLARQATDYCRWALFTANNGWQILHDALLDALTRKAGWVRWHWGARQQIRTEVCEGLLLPQLQMLLAEPGIEAQRIVRRPMTQGEQQALAKTPEGQMYLSQGGAAEYWSATITRSAQQAWPHDRGGAGGVRVGGSWRRRRSRTRAAVWHVRDVTVSELIEMGLPEDKVLAHRDAMMRSQQRREVIARNEAQGHNIAVSPAEAIRAWRLSAMPRAGSGWTRTATTAPN